MKNKGIGTKNKGIGTKNEGAECYHSLSEFYLGAGQHRCGDLRLG